MPIKEYLCTGCNRAFEIRYARVSTAEIEEASGVICPDCGAIAEKLPSKTAPPQFNGSGFYKTDYK